MSASIRAAAAAERRLRHALRLRALRQRGLDTEVSPVSAVLLQRLQAQRQRSLRQWLGLTRAELGRRLRMGEERSAELRLGRYETGRAQVPLVHLVRLARWAGVPVQHFLVEDLALVELHLLVSRLPPRRYEEARALLNRLRRGKGRAATGAGKGAVQARVASLS